MSPQVGLHRQTPAALAPAGPTAPGWRIGAEHVVVLYLGCLMLIPSQLVVRQLGSPGTPANLVGITALAWWAMATLGGHNRVRGLTPLRVGVLLFVLTVLLSYAAATAQGWVAPPSLRQSSDEDWTLIPVTASDLNAAMVRAVDRGLLSCAGWVGIVLVSAEGLRSWRAVNVVLDWLVRFAVVVALLAILQYYLRIDLAAVISIPGLSSDTDLGGIDSRSVVDRVSSTARHPIELGVVMALSVLVAVHRAIFRRRILPWVSVLAIGMALPMAVSRSSLVVFLVGGLLVLISWPASWRFRALVLLPFALIGMRLAAPGLLGTLRALFTYIGSDPSISGRTADYAPVLSLYSDNPFLGRGLFTFVPRYYRIVDNQGLVLLVELGLLGLLATAVLHLVAVAHVALAWRRAATLEGRLTAALVLAGLLSLVSSYVLFDTWGFPMAAGLNFLLLGVCAALGAVVRAESMQGGRP